MPSSTPTLPTILVIFGATGDLTKRKLIPALFRLYSEGKLPSMMHVVGFARRPLSDEDFREYVKGIVGDNKEFVEMISYRAGDYTDASAYQS